MEIAALRALFLIAGRVSGEGMKAQSMPLSRPNHILIMTDDQDQGPDHVRQETLVFLALDLERLPQLAAALLGGRLARGFGLGLGGL